MVIISRILITFFLIIYYLLTSALTYWQSNSEVNRSRFPSNDHVDEVNKLFIVWPFH